MLHAMIEEPLFDLCQDIVYLNHAAVAPWPRAASEAVTAFAAENAHRGAASYPAWLEMEASLRERLRTLINAPASDDIALLKSTSEGLSFIAQGLPWEAGDNIVIPAAEFPSNRMVWQTLEALGVQLREIDIITAEDPEAALIAAMDERTRLLSCSSVQYAYGLRLDLARIGEACRDSDTLFCVDAIQSLGALRFDLEEIGADFVVADGHKWMTGPEGLALFYCKPDLRERLKDALERDAISLKWLVLDFALVSGLDVSTQRVLLRLAQDCAERDIRAVFTGLGAQDRAHIEAGLNAQGAEVLEHLDAALEQIEDELTAQSPDLGDAQAIWDRLEDLLSHEGMGEIFKELRLAPGDTLLRHGERSDDIYLLRSGKLSVSLPQLDGGAKVVAKVRAGAVIGEMAHYAGAERSADIMAQTAAELWCIDMSKLPELEAVDPTLAMAFHRLISANLAKRLKRTTRLLADIGL